MIFAAGWLAPKAMVQAAVEAEMCVTQARALGMDGDVAREEIRAERIRAHERLRPFDWSEVRKQITLRAMAEDPPRRRDT